MRRVLPFVAMLLAYAMMPGAVEITENAMHLLGHGDTAHAGAGHAEDQGSDEHGCSGTYHVCTCHSSPQFVDNAGASLVIVPPDSTRAPALDTGTPEDSGFVRSIDHPPRA